MIQDVLKFIEKNEDNILDLGEILFKNPEIGYKEFKTKEILMDYLKEVELSSFKEFAITGFKATIGEGKPHIGLIADLDALPTKGHIDAKGEDNAAHSCGHNAQMAIMASVFRAIAESGVLDKIGGSISFIGAPAEEFLDFDYRLNLVKEKKLKAFSGKQNLIVEGVFDDIDLLIGSHGNNLHGDAIEIGVHSNGFIAKTATFKGKSAHSGAYPHQGNNALNAAVLGINAVGLLRETFQDDDHIRFHPIIKHGGDAVNTVPHRVVLETYVRGSNIEAIYDANKKINNAFIHSALALGCECEIRDIPGYLPSNYFAGLNDYLEQAAQKYIDKDRISIGGRTFASDDVADISAVKPVLHFGFSGFDGSFHGADFKILNPQMAYLKPVKIVTEAVLSMLSDKDTLYKKLEEYKQTMSIEDYKKNWLNLD
ncbi:MAG: amidohydrolase [Gudongella sp.]|nr:amidohydrolase [Gudongella sp.]